MNLQLQRLRKAAGYANRKDFADVLGVNRATYTSWETGRTLLKLDTAAEIADILQCSLDELAGRGLADGKNPDAHPPRLEYYYDASTGEQQKYILRSAQNAEIASKWNQRGDERHAR